MPRSSMVPSRDALHPSLAAVRPQLRKLCAALGPNAASHVLASPALVAGDGSVSTEEALACLLGRLADAVDRIRTADDPRGPCLRRSQPGPNKAVPKAVRRGKGRRARRPPADAMTPTAVVAAPVSLPGF